VCCSVLQCVSLFTLHCLRQLLQAGRVCRWVGGGSWVRACVRACVRAWVGWSVSEGM